MEEVVDRIRKKWKKDYTSNWDIDLKFGEDFEYVILIPVDKLKRRVKQLVEDGRGKIVMGGDDNVSELALIQIKDIHGVF